MGDSKGGTILRNKQDGRDVYDECAIAHNGLVTWAEGVVKRCVKPDGKKN